MLYNCNYSLFYFVYKAIPALFPFNLSISEFHQPIYNLVGSYTIKYFYACIFPASSLLAI